jgi:heme A synthase
LPAQGQSGVRKAGWRIAGLFLFQVLLGAMVFLYRGAAGLRTAHVAVGSLVLAQSVVLAWELRRRARVCDAGVEIERRRKEIRGGRLASNLRESLG